jgi:hypothetical protein
MSVLPKISSFFERRKRVGASAIWLLALVTLFLCNRPAGAAQTSTYVFLADKSAITQTGGIAGIHRTYTITGTFVLAVDFEAGTASFDRVDANAVDDSPYRLTLDPNEVFNMTALAGVLTNPSSIRFEGKAVDGSSVLITLTLDDDIITLQGETIPPPNSADFFIFALDAVAERLTPCPTDYAKSSEFVFDADRSTATRTGGLARYPKVYTVEGRFRLLMNDSAGTASFDRVDANLVDPNDPSGSRSIDEYLNLSGLAGVVQADGSILFQGNVHGGSDVSITLTCEDGRVHLVGETTPPPDSYDFPIYHLDAVACRKYAGGTGEPNDPYQIATADDLIALGETSEDYDKHFMLTADIDLDPNLPGRKVFDRAVIAPDTNDVEESFQGIPFIGIFNGNGHTISHLTITGGWSIGLFGQLGRRDAPAGEVMNLGILDVNVTGSGYCVGALAGENSGTVTDCYSTGMVYGGLIVGGLVGDNWGGSTMTHCYSTGTVTGNCAVGGLAGQNYAYLSQCYSTAAVSGNDHVGGLVGDNIYGGNVSCCYATGPVNGDLSVGGLVGCEELASVATSFWDIQTSGQTSSEGGTGLTTAAMQTANTFLEAEWDFAGETANGTEDTWWILEGRDYPRLSWQLPADDFEDGRPEPLWFVYEVDPSLVQIKERNGRLETVASAQAQNVDAFYVGDGWRLDATKEFAIRVDFHFSSENPGDGRVTLGIVPSLDPSARQWAELEAGRFDTGPFYLYEVRDGLWVQERVADRSSDDGTLYMSYNPDVDELYFSHTGFGKANAWRTVTGLLEGRWANEPVYVILGGGSEGMDLTGADAWLDNFVLSAGVLVLD